MSNETLIRSIVSKVIFNFVHLFENRHRKEKDDPDGTINRKIHNVFIAELSKDILYYTALVRSFDSSLGNMLEKLAIEVAKISYKVSQSVEGNLYLEQTAKIAELLEKYKRRELTPQVSDYQILRALNQGNTVKKRHDSDYCLKSLESNEYYLIELKIGGDLDNKKSRSEKEALLEQFAILSSQISPKEIIKIKFATAYNKDGEGNEWRQERVKQFFSDEELLIGRDFWNFITKLENGYEIILSEYKNNCGIINSSLDRLKRLYL